MQTLKDIYVDEKKIAYERERYIKASGELYGTFW